MRHVLRRTPLPFPERPSAAPLEGLPARFFLCVLSSPYKPRRPRRVSVASRKPYRQRDQFLSQPAATRSAAEIRARGNSPPQAGAPRLESPRLERRLLRRPGSLFGRHPDLRRARLLLSSQPSAVRNAFSEAADSSSVETRNRRVGYQLCQPALRAGRHLQRTPDGARGLYNPPPLFRKIQR